MRNTNDNCDPIPWKQIMQDSHISVSRKTRLKFLIRQIVGEPYVGKRMKLRHFAALLSHLRLGPKPSILEVGCSDGIFTDWLGRRWPRASVEGIDKNVDQIQACSEWAGNTGRSRQLKFTVADLQSFDKVESYDLIACFDVLEYIRDDRNAFYRLARALKPGGLLLIHGPNVTYQRIDGSLHYVPPERAHEIDPYHVRHGYSPEELRARITEANLEAVDIRMLHGRVTDLAFRIYNLLEHPAVLRILSLPIVDLISLVDRIYPGSHGNTVFGMARKPSGMRLPRPAAEGN